MRIFVLGAGLMGKEVTRDLIRNPNVEQVVVGDLDISRAEQVCMQLQDNRLQAVYMDTADESNFINFIKDFDVVINATVYTLNKAVAKMAIQAGVHGVDLGGNVNDLAKEILALDQEAKQNGTTYITELGVAPGLTNILVGHGAKTFDELQSIHLRVGGIPKEPEPPLEYNQVYSMDGIIYQYEGKSTIYRNGQQQEIPTLSEVEDIYFERFGPLEAFHTAGGTSTLPYTFPTIKNLDYKTIRYPGHAKKIKLLSELHLLRDDYYVELDGQMIRPRDVLAKVLEPILDLGDKEDVVLVRVILEGIVAGETVSREYELLAEFDREHKVTAMARATAYSISVVAQMIGSGLIHQKGVFAPEQIVPGDVHIDEMAKRGVHIKEKSLINN
ncbi:saccharopine dehydrogenase family protein [Ornithinibacillus halotolerans]|uniref:Saccharopine dehydrogenase n=1 Tax=Ornithinibacillus halotolerans TaxID=1274357 RepID=A0A916W946_9BACI|nr:saccharopine dehydrogenase C-terminal domain-containing protein [Ornithinibacillus halotolerans]GGA79144.1 saccharopine dehydrogenase [Ornithinibacillus halotolerans]